MTPGRIEDGLSDWLEDARIRFVRVASGELEYFDAGDRGHIELGVEGNDEGPSRDQ